MSLAVLQHSAGDHRDQEGAEQMFNQPKEPDVGCDAQSCFSLTKIRQRNATFRRIHRSVDGDLYGTKLEIGPLGMGINEG